MDAKATNELIFGKNANSHTSCQGKLLTLHEQALTERGKFFSFTFFFLDSICCNSLPLSVGSWLRTLLVQASQKRMYAQNPSSNKHDTEFHILLPIVHVGCLHTSTSYCQNLSYLCFSFVLWIEKLNETHTRKSLLIASQQVSFYENERTLQHWRVQ